ncbi:MAG: bifunctional folylpolyglutamate synthase/dihydrofolate synthase, partial [Muribaculaceae bacterium]|nr:bifunctional folylpolyglutamate synthase/dihydrofolate synthase [Muribaculaceae bacterium]
MSTYENILEWMYRQLLAFETSGKDGYKPGLATTEALDTLFGNPSRSFKSVHIAGTNGKGSTAHSLAAVLQSAGYRTGLYTSPHLVDFSERIRVNGEPVSHEFVVEFIEEYRKKKASIAPTFFELTTIMAFEWFRRQRVDIAVIETGLGGRLDSTNIITPMLSVITNISLDHTDLLGNTLEAIAAEKAGIIKAGVPVVIGEGGPESERAVFRVKAEETGSPIMFADEKPWFTACQQEGFTQKYIGTPFGDITADLVGECQQKNMATILASLSVLKENELKISDEAVRNGLSQVCKLTHLLG